MSPAISRAQPRRRRLASPVQRQRRKLYWPMLTPALLFYVALFVAPTLYSVYVSLLKWRGQGDPQRWVGLSNYLRLWHDDVFRQSFTNTMTILVVAGIAVFACTFAITAVLREMRSRRVLQAILFFPYMLSPIAIGIGLSLVLSPSGPFDSGLRHVGLGMLAKQWLTPDMLFKTILIGMVWLSCGFFVTLHMAAIGRIPRYYYEQCSLDGANRWHLFRHVTVPLTWDVISVSAVLWTISAVKVFEFVYGFVGISDSPPPQARTLAVEQFLTTTGGKAPQYELGLGSAMGVVMLVVIIVFVLLLRRVMRREALEF